MEEITKFEFYDIIREWYKVGFNVVLVKNERQSIGASVSWPPAVIDISLGRYRLEITKDSESGNG